MRWRDALIILGGAAAWPIAAYAHQTERPRRIGVPPNLFPNNRETPAHLVAFQ
jgi:hypothetical protein